MTVTGRAALPARLAPLLLLALPLAPLTGCGIDDSGPAPAGSPASGLTRPDSRDVAAIHVYFYSATGLERVSRSDARAGDAQQARAAMELLTEGPTGAERARGLVSFLPHRTRAPHVAFRTHGPVEVTVPSDGDLGRAALRQLVCTAADAAGAMRSVRTGDVTVRVRGEAGGGVLATERCRR
ncbi:GerMN domain-containing protein [Streptomyces cacaoi]|uniref:GerMN domain-containing protein n=1 Tax=Streptomyces cacaoi TaxID=1898 RepID=UPI0037499BA9